LDTVEGSEVDPKKTVGELAGATALSGAQPKEETIDLDNTEPEKPNKAAKKPKKNKKTKIPNFDSFRKKLFLGIGALILLIILWVLALVVLPKANITISTATSNVNASPSITINTTAKVVDTTTNTIPGELKQVKKTETQTGTATGQKNLGAEASGSVVMSTSCSANFPTVPSGTAISASGLTFLTQSDATFTVDSQQSKNGHCTFTSNSVRVIAQQNGKQYNLPAGTTYSVSGFSNITATDNNGMQGGVDNSTVTIITQQDIDSAKSKLPDDKASATNDLTKAIQTDGMYVLTGTFSAGSPAITVTPTVGTQATTFTVTSNTTYTMLGVKQNDLQQSLNQSVNSQIDTSKQQIQDYGLDKAAFAVTSNSGSQYQVSVQTTAVIGPKIDINNLKSQVAGKKSGDIHDSIAGLPGVKDVTVKFSPFWVSSAPKKTSKITITLQKSQ
jgi:hypothetical protein